jgi:hypothetical protein
LALKLPEEFSFEGNFLCASEAADAVSDFPMLELASSWILRARASLALMGE